MTNRLPHLLRSKLLPNPVSIRPVIGLTLTCVALICACSPKGDLFHDSKLIPPSGWIQTDSLKWEIPVNSANDFRYDILLELRNENWYPYENIGLELTMLSPDSTVMDRDTVVYHIANDKGQWTGAGWGSLYQSDFIYRENVMLPDSGTYTILIRQAMIDKRIKGINSVGVRIREHDVE